LPNIVLASGSPRRQAFLRELGLSFTVVVADIDERPQPGELPAALARRLAEEKARAVARWLDGEEQATLVIAADTVGALGLQILGKPADTGEATRMLEALRNRPHTIHSAVSVLALPRGEQETVVNNTVVLMRNYSDTEIAAYVASGDPMDKAGAYAIQHAGFAPVTTVDGCVAGVVGLPLGDMARLLARYGVTPPENLIQVCERQTQFSCCQKGKA
jgi:MAF protein